MKHYDVIFVPSIARGGPLTVILALAVLAVVVAAVVLIVRRNRKK